VLALLCDKPKLLGCGANRLGSRYGAPMTFPARRILRRFGPIAAGKTLAAIEDSIRSYIPLKEKRNWQFAHDFYIGTTRQGGTASAHHIYPRSIFASQYLLLHSFPIARMTGETCDWFGVLSRKFGPVNLILKEPPTSGGGIVMSSIPEERALRLSDESWLRVIGNESVNTSNRFFSRRRTCMFESTPEMFSRQFQRAAQRDPSRFARLAMKAPRRVRVEYVAALVSAMGQNKPPEMAPPGWMLKYSAAMHCQNS
jgi:hypothetical protein